MSEVYAIVNLDKYVEEVRDAAAKSICQDNNDNLDEYISLNQMINLVSEHSLGIDEKNRYILDEETNEEIFDSASIWIHNVGLAKLAAKNLVECAWDDESNEMVFWTKDKN